MPTSHGTANTTTMFGGTLLAVSGLLLALHLLGPIPTQVLSPLTAVVLAVGSGVLALGPDSVVGGSRVGRIALLVFGIGPLVFSIPLQATPSPVLLGMSVLLLITIATVVAAGSVVRAGVLHGVARWVPAVVAADALVVAAMSSVVLGPLPFVYLGWHLEFVRPLALLVWGVAIALHGRAPAIRRSVSAIDIAWKRSTEIGGTASEAALDHDAHR